MKKTTSKKISKVIVMMVTIVLMTTMVSPFSASATSWILGVPYVTQMPGSPCNYPSGCWAASGAMCVSYYTGYYHTCHDFIYRVTGDDYYQGYGSDVMIKNGEYSFCSARHHDWHYGLYFSTVLSNITNNQVFICYEDPDGGIPYDEHFVVCYGCNTSGEYLYIADPYRGTLYLDYSGYVNGTLYGREWINTMDNWY